MLVDNIACDTPAGAPPVETSERARQREIAAYLSAVSFPSGIPSGPREKAVINPDPTLNALVQHGALRLDCDRSFLSLIDRQYQFIVAEMTRSHSLTEMKSAAGDDVYLGVCKLDLCWGVCPTTMLAFMDETGEWIQTGPNVIANKSRYIINDFRTNPLYSDKPFTTGFPHMVSYLEVPLISPLGYLLGSYCVVDNRLRDYDNDETIGVMNEIAATIMAHLDLVRLKQNRDRSQQLIKGLGEFIGHPLDSRQGHSPSGLEPVENVGGEPLDKTMALPERQAPRSNSLSSSNESPDFLFSPTEYPDTPPSTSSRLSDKDPLEHASEPGTPLTTPPQPSDDDPSEQSSRNGVAQPPIQSTLTNDIVGPSGVTSTFFRAAATIRRAMGMDGVMFVDAVPTTFAGRSERLSGHGQSSEPTGPFCSVIAQSAVDAPGNAVSDSYQLPEAVLQRFIKRFPRGHLLSADEFGPIDSIFGPGRPYKASRKDHRESMQFRTDVDTIFKVSPGAKYVIFLPLYHFQRQCWFAATLGWVTDQTRAITVADISLLSAFGNSVVAEVSRYEALADSRAKSNFISSISHELRSPLHGILASSELLRDGIHDPLHLSTIDMIESCGTTLLDTFNNVLDHAKLNNTGHISGKPSELRLADLGELVEDVVEAVKLGSQSAFHSALEKDQDVSAEHAHHRDLADHPILVILNIEKFRTEIDVGAWTRIIMNIVGNALKYTSIGHIEVTLKLVQRDDAGHLCDYIYFAVEDTGVGMSPDYLKHKLFTPFSQENSLSPGIGLGLSIVQQLVSGLGGTVDVQSTVAVGSCIEVLVPIGGEKVQAGPDTEDSHVAEALRGQKLCLITAGSNASFTSSEIRSASEIQNRSALFERAFQQNAGRSLGMDVILAPLDGHIPEADFYVTDAGIFDGTEDKDLISPLVILCTGAGSPHCLDLKTTNAHAVHLHHSIGPKKLALALSAALRAKQSSQQSLSSMPVSSPDNPNPPKRSNVALVEPVRDQPNPSAGENPTSPQSPCYHILIVDDNPINVKLLAAVVRKLNHTFATARNGLEAVQLYQNSLKTQRRFDVVFMDISMPIMNGFEATRQIRLLEEDAGAARCKIVVLTGLSGDTSYRQAAASGTDLFLTKPVRLEKVKRILDGESDVT